MSNNNDERSAEVRGWGSSPPATPPIVGAGQGIISPTGWGAMPPPTALPAFSDVPYENPMMREAVSIFAFICHFTSRSPHAGDVQRIRMSREQLVSTMIAAIKDFQEKLTRAGVSAEHREEAGYVLAATVDDVVYNSRQIENYLPNSVTGKLFTDITAGEEFYNKLNTALRNPVLNYNVLELMHACLALGFMGKHRVRDNGMREHSQIQRDLYDTLLRVRPKLQKDLSPHWKGKDMPLRPPPMRVPILALLSVAALLLLGMYINYILKLSDTTSGVALAMDRTFPTTDIQIAGGIIPVRKPEDEPKPLCPGDIRTEQLERICKALEPEIVGGKLAVESMPSSIVIRVLTPVNSPAFFPLGKANVVEEFQPIVVKIGHALKPEPGGIMITGHTDNTPIRTARFASNLDLSIARAKSITELLSDIITQPKRMRVDGKGDTAPIASNDTKEGKARNRRVDIQIPHESQVRNGEDPFQNEPRKNRP